MPPTIRLRGRWWRMLAPKWAHAPLSGEGAAARGGRFNPPGTPALYMSERFITAVAEYEQEFGLRPGTLCAYQVDVADVVDLRDADTLTSAGFGGADLRCPWKHVALVLRQKPPSWSLAERLHREGAAGVRVPSVQDPSGVNLVLWRWNDGPERRVKVLDPLGALPRDQQSWRG